MGPGLSKSIARGVERAAIAAAERAAATAIEKTAATAAGEAALGLAESGGSGGLGFVGKGGGGGRLPTLTIDAATHPQLAEHIANAQAAGHPSMLTYNGGGAAAAANRSAATAGIPRLAGASIDEYPFASTTQGGASAWVGHVPVAQQNAQGAILRNFYGAEGLRPGDSFVVRVINW